jgi:hypothetical protein
MCATREHRYRVNVTIDGVEHPVCFNARGMTEAVAKADGWAAKNYPHANCVGVQTYRTTYGSEQAAAEHGAILPA